MKDRLIRETDSGMVMCNDTMYHAIGEQRALGGMGRDGEVRAGCDGDGKEVLKLSGREVIETNWDENDETRGLIGQDGVGGQDMMRTG